MKQPNDIPHNIEAEEAVLGSLLIDPRAFDDVAPLVRAGDFYAAKNRAVFEAMAAMHQAREAVDFVTLSARLESAGKAKLTGGVVYLSELMGRVPSAMNAMHYARIVAGTATRREILDAASAIAKAAYDEGLDLNEAQGRAESAVFAVRRSKTGNMRTIAEAVSDVYTEFERIQAGEIPAAVSTGYTDIDRYMRGWRRQEQTIVAARPGIGKTALLVALAIKSAKAGYGTLIFSAEMNYKALVKRMLQAAGVANLPGLSDRIDWQGISDNMGQLADLPLWIDDTPNINIMDIRARSMRLSAERRIDHIFVDYVQLIGGPRRRDSRYLEIGDITKALKQLCRELDNHICTAAQLSRKAENVRPTLDALKESGSIEEDADNVIFIHRNREIPEGTAVVQTEIIIAKQRNGPTGDLTLGWMPERVTFVPPARNEGIHGHTY